MGLGLGTQDENAGEETQDGYSAKGKDAGRGREAWKLLQDLILYKARPRTRDVRGPGRVIGECDCPRDPSSQSGGQGR